MSRPAFDPYAPTAPAPAWRFLHGLNPLAKLAAALPSMLLLVFTRDLATPAAFLVLAYAVLLVGARLTARSALVAFGVLPVFVLVVGVGFTLWTDASRLPPSAPLLHIGSYTLYGAAVAVGFATALRLAAIVALALIAGLTTTGPDLARALVQNLRVPYRIGYTAIAAFRFVPRFSHELDVIRAAHRVRGAGRGRGPIAAVRRRTGYVVPLLAGGIRHAERMALAMDARAFGAYPTRTERHLVPMRARDAVFVGAMWVVTAGLLWTFYPWGR